MKVCKNFLWTVRGVVFLASVVLISFSVAAQLPTATILGTVKDATGAAVAGAIVTVTNTGTGVTRTGPTMDDGSYRFPALAVGNYQVSVMKEGFQTTTRTGITLTVDQAATIDVTLQVGATTQTVEVTGEAPLVNTTTAESGNLVSDQQVVDLPLNGRNWTDLTLMQPGVTQVNAMNSFNGTGTPSGSFINPPGLNGVMMSSNGGTVRSNIILLDGADTLTLTGFGSSSAINSNLGVDGIQEYKVVTVLPDASYGLAMAGSFTTIVSKGGTNQWHGTAFDFLRNSSLDANQYNVPLDTQNINGCGTQDLLNIPCKRIPEFQRNQFGAAFGGPIQKNKTFFYAVYEGLRQRQGGVFTYTTLPAACFVNASSGAPLFVAPNGIGSLTAGGSPITNASQVKIPSVIQNNGCVPNSATNPITVNPYINALDQFFPVPNVPLTQNTSTFNFSNPYTTPSSEDYGQIRVDHTFSASDSIFVRYTHDDTESYALNGTDIRNQLDANSKEIFTTASETHIFSPTVLNTARLSWSRNIQQLFASLAASTLPNVPTETVNSATQFVTDISNPEIQQGSAAPGQIPQICNGTLTHPTSTTYACSGVLSRYGSAQTVAGYATPGSVNQNIYTLSDDVFWTKGKNAFKFGALINRFDQYPYLIGFGAGTATFASGANISNAGPCDSTNSSATPTSCPLAGYFEGVYTSLGRAVPGSVYFRHFTFNTIGFYAQDDMKATSRLTLNLGLRYEFATVPTEHDTSLAFSLRFPETDPTGTAGPMFQNPSLHNFSPRIGFAYDVFGNGKTAIRGGAGMYYDIGSYGQLGESNDISTPNDQLLANGQPGYLSGTITYNDPSLTGVSCCSPANSNGGNPLIHDQVPFAVPLPNVANTAVASPRTVQYNLQQPTMLQRNLAIDQQLPGNMSLTASYVGAKDWHLYQEAEGNPQAYYPLMTPGVGCNSSTIDSINGCTGVIPAVVHCPGTGCAAVTPYSAAFSSTPVLPYYCAPADGSAGPPSAAHPCFNNAAVIPCTTIFTPGAGGQATCPGKTNPAWNQVSDVTTSGEAFYNSLQVVLTKRTSHGFQAQFAYTWQKLLDTGTGQSTLENALNVHEFPLAGNITDLGVSQYSITDGIRANLIYRVPNLVNSNGFRGKLINGWGISAIPSIQTGYPLQANIATAGGRPLDNAVFVVDRTDLCPTYDKATLKSTAIDTGNRTSSTFVNPNMFCLPALGTLGNEAKGMFTGPGMVNADISITKDTKAGFLGEQGDIQFRFEMFNFINHMNWSNPNLNFFTPISGAKSCPAGGSIEALTAAGCGGETTSAGLTGGQDALTTITPPRQMQVSLRLSF